MNYKDSLVNSAIKLDKVLNQETFYTQAVRITSCQDKSAVFEMCKMLSILVCNSHTAVDILHTAKELNDNLIKYYGYYSVRKICNSKEDFNQKKMEKDNERIYTLEELLSELNELVGLKTVKEKVRDLIAYQKVKRLRQIKGLRTSNNTLHMAFMGNPGTGKTTVARIVGRIYRCLGLLSKGQFIEVSRTDLIAGYQGQTALKVHDVIERAKGGVLFIDEAYSITENENCDSYGRECLTELTKGLEDYREDLVVIVAGYTELMKTFFLSNPGLKSRFNTFIEFPDYDTKELKEILFMICKNNDYFFDKDACEKINKLFETQGLARIGATSNGRFIRNFYEDLVINHARRLAAVDFPSKEMLQKIIAEDIYVNVGNIK